MTWKQQRNYQKRILKQQQMFSQSSYFCKFDSSNAWFFWDKSFILRWMIKVCRKCGRKGLSVNDLYKPLKKDQSEVLGDLLEEYWNLEKTKSKMKNCKPSLLKAILNQFGYLYIYSGLLMFFVAVFVRLQNLNLKNT